MLDTLSAGLFAPALGEAFALHGAEGEVLATTLVRCNERPTATMAGSARTAFSLVFACPAEAAGSFAGGHCLIVHDRLGSIGPLYLERIMPLGLAPNSAAFEAVFN
ncbi:DUF6916 family protein [Methylobacterium indicum]|uniref:DUF6916 domain-containing protein n=1 Tax=Methylobacterium indicum TaxID=1775910 RepID=A0A8H8WQC1_9HYPH|nr:hypothetical protein [Methylobacterium indicum]BCM82424.1 hypothetical protein mvi_08850 [Methylobacterium indicum]